MDKGLITHSIIFNEKNQILILKRSSTDDVLPDYWDIPGGTLKDGEDPTTGTIREVKEEAGIDIENPSLFFYTSTVDQAKNKQFVILIFIAQYQSGEIVLNHNDHDDYQWINLDDPIDLNLVDYLYPCFDLLKNKRHKLFEFHY